MRKHERTTEREKATKNEQMGNECEVNISIGRIRENRQGEARGYLWVSDW